LNPFDCGAFIASRSLFDHDLWRSIHKFRVFFYLFGNAVHNIEGWHKGTVFVKRGQILKSYRRLIDDLEYVENKSIKRYSLSTIKRLLDELVKEGRIKLLGTELGTLITIVNYEEYQCLSNYSKEQLGTELGTVMEHSWNNNKNVKNVKNDSLKDIYAQPEEVIPEKPKKAKKEKEAPNLEQFELFWQAYPKKKAKDAARKAWLKIKLDEQLLAIILTAIETAKKSNQWMKDNEQYIPLPASWLNGKRWEDEYMEGGATNGRKPTSKIETSRDTKAWEEDEW